MAKKTNINKVRTEVFNDALVLFTADMYTRISEIKKETAKESVVPVNVDDIEGLPWTEVSEILKGWAEEFTKMWMEKTNNDVDDEFDFVDEIESFEDEHFENLKKVY